MNQKIDKTIYKLKWKNLIVILLSIILVMVVILGIIFSFIILRDYNATKELINEISDKEVIKNSVDDENTEVIKQESTLSKFDVHWEYIKLSLLDVDMSKLKKINSNAVGYIDIKGTKYSYPVVQKNNNDYKKTSFDKKNNSYGWIYLDEKNNLESLDVNTVILGNKVWGNVLSGALYNLLKKEWYENDDNHIIKYSTSYYSTLWRIISVYKTKDANHLKTDFENEKEIQDFADTIIKKSEIKFKVNASDTDKFLTVTTNSNGENIVIHAKLIKIKEEK